MEVRLKKSSGLFRTIYLASLLCMLFSVLIVSYISISRYSTNLSQTARDNLQQLAAEKMNEVSSMIDNQVQLTKSVSESSYVEQELDEANDQERLTEYLGMIGKNAGNLYENFFITRGSAGYADCLSNATLHDVKGEPWYETCLTSGEFLGNNVSPVTGRPVYVISYAVKRNGRTIGGLNNSIDLATMTGMITNSIQDEDTKVLIIDTEGNVIASANSDQILKTNFNAENDSTKEAMKTMLRDRKGFVEFSFDGNDNIGAYTNIGTMFTLVYMNEEAYKEITAVVMKRIILWIVLCIIVASVIIAIISASIVRPITVVNSSITSIANGNADLTKRVDLKARNEVKSLVEGFNLFSSKMQNLVMEIKGSQDELSKVGDTLQDSTYETESSITEIIANIKSVNDRILAQSKVVDRTAGTIKNITENLGSLDSMIGTQGDCVKNAYSEVEEMLSNINEVNSLVTQMSKYFNELKDNIVKGSAKQNDVTQRVKQIEEQSKTLNEANLVISNIAKQTNLLAMNAAIEAAHAGESGKGFSVVADEIRKLSETSTQQSKRINEELQAITDSITSVVGASQESLNSYSEISEKIEATGDSFRKIQTSMEKQASGSNEISRSLNELNENTSKVLGSSKEISEQSLSILGEMKTLQDSSYEMKQNIAEMTIGAKKINETGENLTAITKLVKDSISKSNAQIGKFKV